MSSRTFAPNLRRISGALLFMAFFAVFFTGCPWKNRKADLILKNGVFFTGNSLKPYTEMIAIRGNRILAAGKSSESRRITGPATRVIDCQGMFGCAGFNDAHAHFLSGGQSLAELDLTGVRTVIEMQRRILERAWRQPWGSWIIGRGWDQNLFPDGEWPTKRMLSEIQLDDYPVFLQRICGHAVLVNEKVLRFAGISAKTPDPPAGVIGRDPSTGEPNGILKEDAIRLVSQYLPRQGADSVRTFLEYALAEARRFGVTSVQDLSGADALSLYKGFLDEEKLTCRISVGFPLENNLSDGLKARQALKGAMLHFGLFKGILDGSMGARTALFFEPYTDDPSTSGIPQLSESSLYDMTYSADSARFQMALHAIGDRAVHMALDAFERFPPREGVPERRNRIEHAQVVDGADFGRFRALGVIASVQPSHCIFDMAWAESRIGPERCRRAYAWKTLLRSGARLAFGSDWPVAPLNPVVGLYAAVSRRDTTGLPEGGWHPEERLSIEEAILAYTLGSAAAEFMENEKGSLEQGKLADLVIFDRNLTTCTHEELLDAQVVRTVVDGKIVYEQNP